VVEERRLADVQNRVYELDNHVRLGETRLEMERREIADLDARAVQAQADIAQVADERTRGASELAARSAELAELTAEVDRERDGVAA
jgi:hypothetical protein